MREITCYVKNAGRRDQRELPLPRFSPRLVLRVPRASRLPMKTNPAGAPTVSLHPRRTFLRLGLGATAAAFAFPRAHVFAAAAGKPLERDDPDNTKIAHRITLRGLKDDDLLFFQQIGLRWARIEYSANEPLSFDQLKAEQDRFSKYGMKIFSVVHPAYRSLKVQLGLAGRD